MRINFNFHYEIVRNKWFKIWSINIRSVKNAGQKEYRLAKKCKIQYKSIKNIEYKLKKNVKFNINWHKMWSISIRSIKRAS